MSAALSAKTRLGAMVAHKTFPEITVEELDALLELAAIPDRQGRIPSDAGWIPTYDLYRAAAEGWAWKMARVSDLANIRTGDLTHVDSALIRNCQMMLQVYQRGVNGSPTIRNSVYRGVGVVDAFAGVEDEEE